MCQKSSVDDFKLYSKTPYTLWEYLEQIRQKQSECLQSIGVQFITVLVCNLYPPLAKTCESGIMSAFCLYFFYKYVRSIDYERVYTEAF